jgi:hypothetical protein
LSPIAAGPGRDTEYGGRRLSDGRYPCADRFQGTAKLDIKGKDDLFTSWGHAHSREAKALVEFLFYLGVVRHADNRGLKAC